MNSFASDPVALRGERWTWTGITDLMENSVDLTTISRLIWIFVISMRWSQLRENDLHQARGLVLAGAERSVWAPPPDAVVTHHPPPIHINSSTRPTATLSHCKQSSGSTVFVNYVLYNSQGDSLCRAHCAEREGMVEGRERGMVEWKPWKRNSTQTQTETSIHRPMN